MQYWERKLKVCVATEAAFPEMSKMIVNATAAAPPEEKTFPKDRGQLAWTAHSSFTSPVIISSPGTCQES